MDRFFELALAEVRRYEGTINEFVTHGFIALFGAPFAHEDHARCAVLAALGIQCLVRECHADLGLPPGEELGVRMGLHTGHVVIGRIGDDLRMDYTAIGDTMDLALALQHLAEPGTTLLSEATSRLVRGSVSLDALNPVRVQGKAVGELCTNSIKHAYQGVGGQPIRVLVRVFTDRLVIEVEDFGTPFNPQRGAAPDFDTLPEHGMGLYLAREIADAISFDVARERGTRWTLVKYLQGRRPNADRTSAEPGKSS